MSLGKNALRSTAVPIVMLASLVACSTSPDRSAAPEARESFGPTSWDVVPTEDLKSGGTLRLAINAMPKNFNDRVAVGNGLPVSPNAPTRGSAVDIMANGSWQVNTDYADSVELIDKDPQTVRVKLNDQAVWQDGSPIVAADMIGWWKALNGSDDDFNVRSTTGFEDIESVEQGKDRFTYTVTFDGTVAGWPQYVYPGMPESATSTAKTFNTGFTAKPTPSNGPFVLSKITDDGVTATPNPRWWGKKPRLDKIEYRVVKPDQQATAFADDTLDAIDVGQDEVSYDIARDRDDTEVQRSGSTTWTQLTFNGAKGPLKDVKVRRAIAHAINRKEMAARSSKPLGAPAVSQGSMIYLPGQTGYRDNASAAIGFDIAKSMALLKSAGFTRGPDGLAKNDGKPLTLTLTVPADTPANAERARQIQTYLKRVGITVKLDTVPVSRYFEDYVIPLNFEMATFSWRGGPFPVAAKQPLFNPVDSGRNYTGITSPKLDDLWDKANAALDPQKQIALANDIDRALFDYVPIVPIAALPTVYVVADDLANFGASQFEHPDFAAVGFTK